MEPLPGGARNAVWRSLPGTHPSVVFKTTRRCAGGLAWLGPVQAQARIAGFEVPELIRSTNGHLSERGWTCEPFIEGELAAPEEMVRLAPLMARFHLLTQGLSQRPGFASAEALIDAYTGGDVDLLAMPPGLVRACRAAWRATAGGEAGIIHGDLNPRNVIRTPRGTYALLDWDEARYDWLLFDRTPVEGVGPSGKTALAIAAWEVACCWQIEPQRARALAARYFQE
ncbi:phosphotransferase [uncultured Roseobacter sp.]|uniref:phosphotransferase enzyme family protein n=1 Tax=uncultured Roseobacter sp. TaxID=114847 RepID=UPI00263065E5|nr:phosphotransferase [uncultured Roseobacter sp.]